MSVTSQDIIRRFNSKVLDGPGPTVVLGHGIGTDQTAWSHQAEALNRAGYRVMTFDFAGATPQSASHFSPTHHRTLYGFAEDLLVLLQVLNLQNVSFVGHSVSGMVGVLAAVAEPERFKSLILLGASPRYIDEPETGYVGGWSAGQVEEILEAARDDYVAWANGFAEHIVGDPTSHLSSAEFTSRLLELRPDIVHSTLTTVFTSDHRAEVDRLQTPMSVIQASEDFAVPWAVAKWLAEHGRARDLIEIPARGHLPHITAPEAVTDALIACLQRD